MTEVDKLKQNDPKTIERLYLTYKSNFLFFAKRYNVSDADSLDIYQDAFIALVENAKKGKLDTLSSEIKTYLFSIGKYMIFALNKKQKTESIEDHNWQHATEWEELDLHEEKINVLEKSLDRLGEQCYKILKLFYYENKKLDEMMNSLAYESKDVLKSQKARCIKQLKEMISKS